MRTRIFSIWLALLFIPAQLLNLAGSARLASPSLASADGFVVLIHPEAVLRVGDQISLDIFSPAGLELNRREITASLIDPYTKELGKAQFFGTSGQRYRAIFQWVWDTSTDQPGIYRIQFDIADLSIHWEITLRLEATLEDEPPPTWQTYETEYTFLHVIEGSEAHRDIQKLLSTVRENTGDLVRVMGEPPKEKIHINMVPRTLGQGGFASSEIYITYRDENYVNPDVSQLIRHEFVHRLDAQVESKLRPSFFIEGLAVYLTGGHYKPQPVMLLAASLVRQGNYLPLPYLIDHFYPSQHESGYLQAGAFIEFLVRHSGWDQFEAFYRDINDLPGQPHSESVDAALQSHYGQSLRRLENLFLDSLGALPDLPDIRAELMTTIYLYDTIRDYQRALDPAAYFEQAWLPDARQMREKGITADYLRNPSGELNLRLEKQLYLAGNSLIQGELTTSVQTISRVRSWLTASGQALPPNGASAALAAVEKPRREGRGWAIDYWQAANRNGNKSHQ